MRLRGHSDDVRNKAGLWSISGNLISSQALNVHLQYVRGISVAGNTFFSGHDRTMRIEQCDYVAVQGNVNDYNPDYRKHTADGVVFERCTGCTFTGSAMRHTGT